MPSDSAECCVTASSGSRQPPIRQDAPAWDQFSQNAAPEGRKPPEEPQIRPQVASGKSPLLVSYRAPGVFLLMAIPGCYRYFCRDGVLG